MIGNNQTRRQFSASLLQAGIATSLATLPAMAQADPAWQPRYILNACLYGYTALEEIVPEVAKAGASAIDIWPMVHGNQREQLDEMGEEKFAALLRQHAASLGCITQYKLGPFALQDEMRLARRLSCTTIVTGGQGPKGLQGSELKLAVAKFVEQMKPHVAFADIDPDDYAGILFSGGRAPEYIRYDEDLIRVTKHFFAAGKPIASVCHGVEIPAYADCVRGRRMATVLKCKFDLEVCGGIFVNEPCVIDGNLVSGRTYHDNRHYVGPWIKML